MLAPSLRAGADPVTETLYYTTFGPQSGGGLAGNSNYRVWKVSASFDGTSLSLGTPFGIALPDGSDGIVFDPTDTNYVLVGGQGTGNVYRTNVNTGATSSQPANVDAYHLSVDPSGTKVWAAGIPGNLASLPLGPLQPGTQLVLSGPDTQVDSLAFAAGKVFYTSSGSGGNGDVGTVDLSTGVTTQLFTNLPAAHGMVYDPYSGKLVLFGARHITQIDPFTDSIYSDLSLSSSDVLSNLDQGAADGQGHVWAADNGGNLVFLDYSAAAGFMVQNAIERSTFLAGQLDDLAPLTGPGSQKVPEPGAAAMLAAMFGVGMLSLVRRRQR